RRDPNCLTISSHHRRRHSSIVIIITLEGKPETRSKSSHLISSRSQSDEIPISNDCLKKLKTQKPRDLESNKCCLTWRV
ncbi:unnamed protein product, partial [Brassica rapa]